MNHRNNWQMKPAQHSPQRAWWKYNATAILFICGAILLIALGVWYYMQRQPSVDPNHLPVIQPSEGPSRIRPENADDMQIEHDDKLVYDRLAPRKENHKELLLPETEEPIDASEYLDLEKTHAEKSIDSLDEDEKILADTILAFDEEEGRTPSVAAAPATENVEAVEEKTIPQEESEAIEQTTSKIQRETVHDSLVGPPRRAPQKLSVELRQSSSASLATNTTIPVAELEEEAVADETPQAVTKGYHYVQLASVRTPQQAEATWTRLQRSPLLKGHDVRFQKVDLGEKKGIFYRVQAGPFPEHKAESLCQQLRDEGKDCFVTK